MDEGTKALFINLKDRWQLIDNGSSNGYMCASASELRFSIRGSIQVSIHLLPCCGSQVVPCRPPYAINVAFFTALKACLSAN